MMQLTQQQSHFLAPTKQENKSPNLPRGSPYKNKPFTITSTLLGKGTNSRVYLGVETNSSQKLAIKVIDLPIYEKEAKEKLKREVTILSLLTSLNSGRFVKLHQVFKSNKKQNRVFITMEYIPGCDLFEFCENQKGPTDQIYKRVIYNILLAIKELHDLQICHLDLKLENIMYNSQTNSIQLIDFGFSQFTTSDRECGCSDHPQILQTSYAGSVHYAPPEILQRIPYDGKKADVWSLGVLCFSLLTGEFPFDDGELNDVCDQIINHSVIFPSTLTAHQRHFISLMLQKDPSLRPDISSLLLHPYFSSLNLNSTSLSSAIL